MMDLFQIAGRLIEVVVTDNALRIAVARNLTGDLHFEINIIHPVRDRRPQQRHTFFLRPSPKTTVFGSSTSCHHRTAGSAHQTFQVDRATNEIQTQLNQLSALFDNMFVFRHHHGVTSATNTNANHYLNRPSGKKLRREGSGTLLSAMRF